MDTTGFQPWDTSLEAAKANTRASSTAMAAHLNEELKKRYLLAFDGWKTSVLAGKIDNTNPPKPFPGYDVVTSEDGFAYPALGNTPVCEMPEIPEDHSKPFVQVLPEPDHVRNVPKGDTTPVGFIITSEDGAQWQRNGASLHSAWRTSTSVSSRAGFSPARWRER